MKRWSGLIVGAGLALASLMASPSLAASPPPTGGTIAIEAKTADGSYDPALHLFVDALSQNLTARGFTILEDPAHTAYVADVTLSRAAVGTGLGKDPQAEPISVGAGVNVPLSTGRSSIVTLRRTRLELRIEKRGEEGTVWNGAAVTVRPTGTPKGATTMVAADLVAALTHDYPTEPKDVVGVP